MSSCLERGWQGTLSGDGDGEGGEEGRDANGGGDGGGGDDGDDEGKSLESLRSLLLRAAVVPFPCTLLPTFRGRAGRRHRCEARNGAPSPSSAGHCEMRESLPWSS